MSPRVLPGSVLPAPSASPLHDGPPSPGRRRFLGTLAAASALTLLPEKPAAASPVAMTAGTAAFWAQPRRLDLIRAANGERFTGCYWHNGAVEPAGYAAACRLLRDVRADVAVAMSPRLLDLLCAIQAWVRPYGYTEPMRIYSGYRTPETNAHLEGAARQSMHLRGQAADIVMPGLPTAYLGQLAARYAAGGVGFYFTKDFIHVDTGRIRFWSKGVPSV